MTLKRNTFKAIRLSGLISLIAITAPLASAGGKDTVKGWNPSAPLLRTDDTQVPGGCPIESPGGKFIFTARNPGTGLDIYVNQRPATDQPFEPGNALPAPANDPAMANDFCPTPREDGALYFVSNRDGGCGGPDMMYTVNNPVTGYAEPVNLGCAPDGPNTPGTEFSPSILETRYATYLLFSTDYYSGNQDIYISRMRKDGKFGPGKPLPWPVNTGYDDRQPNIRQDGLELVFTSDRPSYAGDDTGFDIYSAKRATRFNRWRRVVNLSETVPFDSVSESETRPSISWDGQRLVYGSGGVWVSEKGHQ